VNEVQNVVPTPVTDYVQIVAATTPRLRSMVVDPSSASDHLVTVVPSLIKKVSNFIPSSPSPIFFRNLILLYLDHVIS
jgi:hypothetical protein